jgi:hypothetical protein
MEEEHPKSKILPYTAKFKYEIVQYAKEKGNRKLP